MEAGTEVKKRVEDAYRLSPVQEGMLYHSLLDPGSGVYVTQIAMSLDQIDPDALEAAWQRVVDRHEILRTAFAWQNVERPLQVVGRGVRVRLQRLDYRSVPRPEQDRRLEQFLREDRQRPFNLARAPLMRLAAILVGDAAFHFVWSFHHILLDGWSLPLVLGEVFAVYGAIRAGKELRLEPRRPYRDYIRWTTSRDLSGAERYWRQALRGIAAPTPLGVDREASPRPEGKETYASEHCRLSSAATGALQTVARQNRLTLNTIVQGAWALVLSRYSGEQQVVYGTTVSGRPPELAGVEQMVGLFINTLPVRVAVRGEEPLLPWLKRLQEQLVDLRQYEHVALGEIHHWSEVPRSAPLFESIVVFENYPSLAPPAGDLGGLRMGELRFHDSSNYPLTLVAAPGEVLSFRIVYDARRLEAPTVARLLGHWRTVLEEVSANPHRKLAEVRLVSEPERRTLLRAWNETRTAYPTGATVHEALEAQAHRTPEAVAVVFEDERLSYRDLNERANRLARHLRSLGVGADTRVGICCERSLEMVVGLLGILKAGGAYLPLDPNYPTERLAFMLADAGVPVLLTQQRLVGGLPEHGARVVCLDTDWAQVTRHGGEDLAPVATSEHLAYVTYTSGSTGTPKGVEVRHRGVLRLLFGVDYAELEGGQTFLQLAPVSFDASTLEIWGALLHGGRCVVFPERVPSASELGKVLREHSVTTLWLTASLFNAVIDQAPDALSGLSQLLIGGEALSVPHVKRGLERLPSTRIINGYGPTEGTTFTCCYAIPRDLGEESRSIPIGRPIGNTRVYVLDRELDPVPVGVAGELYIGGDGLARGYLGRPELTAERFVPDPFSQEGGERLYRTGDLVRYRADGNIEFLGRMDNQVKVRGFRIELGEIEAALAKHPAVREAIVLAREDQPGEKRLVAYVSAADGGAPTVGELRSHAKGKLPEHMVPSAFVVLEALPLLPNGKVDRRALPAPEGGSQPGETYVAPRNEVEEKVAAVWRDVLKVERVGVDDNFFDLGGHSLRLLQVHGRLQQVLNRDLAIVELFQYPTIDSLVRHLRPETREPRPLEHVRTRKGRVREGEGKEIAIIAMSGRFPGARNVDELWRNLRQGLESVRPFSDEELRSGVNPALLKDPRYVKAGGALDGVDLFDAAFFRYHAREAESIDPQHRLFLECAWEALESAGYDPERYPGRIGLYAGSGANNYLWMLAASHGASDGVGALQAGFGTASDFLATRVSYKLNLRGPSLNVQTACSTSLVAVHLACQSLLDGECDLALGGGVSIRLPDKAGYLYEEGGILSPDGHCRAFDARAQGTVGGNGVGIVVLKRLEEALADGDRIEGTILGTAINNDGAAKVGYTAPSIDGQVEVILAAQAAAGVKPSEIGYIEAHGTGTPLGDPIEVAALTKAFRADTSAKSSCAIGSLKTNLGHLDAAAGVAGLIKAVLTVKHGEIPPSLHFENPNPAIDFANSPFHVNAALWEWKTDGKPRTAGVSSFGIGGTNAHVVLREPPPAEDGGPSRSRQVLVLSARSASALDHATANLADHLQRNPELNLADVAYTLATGRGQFPHRRMVVCRDLHEAGDALEKGETGRVEAAAGEARGVSVAFLFPGQGSQYAGMGRELYREETVFRDVVDRCCEALAPELGLDLRSVLYPPEHDVDAAGERLRQTFLSQPALFVVEYAMARLWLAWGVKPGAMIGHSIGEYVAACLAGVFTVEEGLKLVAARGRLMQELPPGLMVAVGLAEEKVRPLLDGQVSVAANNGPSLCVVSGPTEAVEGLQRELGRQGVECRRLLTSHAFHSGMVEPVLAAFAERVGKVALRAPGIPYVSNVTGTWIRTEEATDPQYWAMHLRHTVRFGEGVAELLKERGRELLEVGPGQTLSGLVRQHPGRSKERLAIATMRHLHESGSDLERVLKALGRLWLAGVDVDWASFHGGERRRRVALPTYPFERQRYWAEPLATRKAPARSAPRKTTDIADWFYVPSWHRSAFPSPAARNGEARWLVFVDDSRWGAEVLRRLERSARAVAVRTGGSFVEVGDRAYAVDPRRPEDYGALLRKLRARDHVPNRVAHLWGVTSDAASGSAGLDELQDRGFYSLLFLAQAMAQELPGQPLDIALVTSGVQDVTAGEALCPGKAMALGPCKVIPQEYPAITCRSIDIDTPDSGTSAEREVERLVAEIEGSSAEPVVAHRRNRRWVQRFQPLRVEARTGRPTRLREGGVYLITGGLGGVGLEIATSLAKAARAKLVLTTRSLFPPREEWLEWRRTHDEAEATTRRIHRIRELEDLGAEVLIVRADVAREPEMRAVVARTIERFGVLHGVVHAAGAEKRGRSIAEADRAHCERQFLPKVEGLTVLAKVLEGQPIDFCIVYSSLASVLGVIGFASYTAAHLFMDAFVGQQNRADGGVPWICVNSDNWQTRQFAGPVLLGLSDFMMAPDEGAEVFQRILGLDGETQVVVSTGDLQARVDRWVTRLLPGEDQAPVEAVARHVRPDLATPYAAPRNEAERTVAGIWQTLLGIERVGIHDNFFALGGDSVLSIQVAARSAEQGIPLSSHEVLEHQTIAELARVSGVRRVTPLGQGVAGRVPLTPIQHWFFAQGLVEPEHFNQAMLLEVVQPVELSLLEQAWQRLVERHDALRLRYVEDEKGWHGVYGDSDASAAITRIDLAERAEAEQRAAVEAAAAGIQSRLDLSQGPLVRVVYFDLGSSRTARLFLIIHHLLVDVVSWRILSEDLQTALRQLGAAQAIQLPSPSTPFGRWAQELEQHAKSGAVDAEAAYWLSLPWDRVVPLPVDKPGGVNTAGSIGTVSLSFEVEETRRLMQELPERYQVQVNEVLLTAVAMALRSWTGAGVLLIDVEGHGREAVVAGADLSRTVGWFTTLFPLLVDLEGPGEPLVLLKRVKERLRAVPNHGIGYGLLRHVRKDEATENALRALPLPEVSFLYLGRFDPAMAGSALFKPAAESSGPTRSPRGRRQHLLEVAAHVSEGRLWARWIYSGELHHRSTIETLAEAFADALRTLLRPTESTGLDTRIAADFPGTRLDKNELQEFLSSLGQPGGTPSR